MSENKEKGKLIKQALTLVDDIAKLDIEEMENTGNMDDLDFLINKAQKLKKNRLFVLK